MITILIFSLGICLAYSILIVRYGFGWDSIPEFHTKPSLQLTDVSVIIAFRNEEKNLPALFKALHEQTYPQSATEVIFVDDHSLDKSAQLVKEFVGSYPNAFLQELDPKQTGKKKALAAASVEAKGKLLLFTDADCIPSKTWIETIVSYYQQNHPLIIAGPVILTPSASFFSRFQSLEFFSLIATTAGAFGNKNPIMVNGANLAVEKEIYTDSIEFLENQTPSGDDVFLLFNIKKKFPDRLLFLKSTDACVYTKPHSGLFSYLQQRLRWVSKARYYKDKSIIAAAVIVLLINLWLLNCLIMSFINPFFLFFGGVVFLIKSVADYLLLRKVLVFFDMKSLLKIFMISQFLYFLFVTYTGIAGNFISSRWKGRIVK